MYLFLFLLTGGVLLSFFHHLGLCTGLTLLLLVLVVERIIHTTYTLTADGRMVVSHGRFSRTKVVDLRHVRRVERCRRLRVGGHSLFACLMVVCDDERCVAVMPVDEEEFVRELSKRVVRRKQNPTR